jgi:hypothetical protein
MRDASALRGRSTGGCAAAVCLGSGHPATLPNICRQLAAQRVRWAYQPSRAKKKSAYHRHSGSGITGNLEDYSRFILFKFKVAVPDYESSVRVQFGSSWSPLLTRHCLILKKL